MKPYEIFPITRMNYKPYLCALAIVTSFLAPSLALGDGIAFQTTSASTEVRATAQRAIMWLRASTWEIHVQPVFDRGTGQSAWVIPFPVRPTVSESNAELFDQLEMITSPVFMKTCYESHSDEFGCMTKSVLDGASSLAGGPPSTSVQVWERGDVGDLDYVLLSATDADSLVDWLTAGGYVLPAGMDTAIAQLDTEGQFYFVATLDPTADPGMPLTPVRFVLPDMQDPTYPLRLTGFGAPGGETLDLTLWVIATRLDMYMPVSHPHGTLDDLFPGWENRARDIDELDDQVDTYFESEGNDRFLLMAALDYAESLWNILENGQVCNVDFACVTLEALGLTAPDPWSDELLEIQASGQWILRYQARLDAAAMATDLVLGPGSPDGMWWMPNVYTEYLGDCDALDDGGCSLSGIPSGSAFVAIIVVALLVLLGLRPGRRS
jgi:hypothetical protein